MHFSSMRYSLKTFMSQLALLVLVHANGDAALHQARDNLIARTTDNKFGSPTPAPCPTTLKVPQRLDCGGCYSTIYPNTNTKSVDCGGCKTLTTETQYNFLVGVCPVSVWRCEIQGLVADRSCRCALRACRRDTTVRAHRRSRLVQLLQRRIKWRALLMGVEMCQKRDKLGIGSSGK